MWDFVKTRAKAFIAALVPAVVLAVIKAFESSFGADVPADQEAAIVAWVAGLFGFLLVERVPNKTA